MEREQNLKVLVTGVKMIESCFFTAFFLSLLYFFHCTFSSTLLSLVCLSKFVRFFYKFLSGNYRLSCYSILQRAFLESLPWPVSWPGLLWRPEIQKTLQSNLKTCLFWSKPTEFNSSLKNAEFLKWIYLKLSTIVPRFSLHATYFSCILTFFFSSVVMY